VAILEWRSRCLFGAENPKTFQSEIERVMAEAERLHEAICSPLVSPQGDHYKACLALNEAIARAIVEITGSEPPWVYSSSSCPS